MPIKEIKEIFETEFAFLKDTYHHPELYMNDNDYLEGSMSTVVRLAHKLGFELDDEEY